MGLQIGEIVPKKEIKLEQLQGRIIAVDSFNTIYQFLANIRQPDGTPLMDKKGNVTSHLSGLFYRTINLLQLGIKPIFVFDGKSPELKKAELEGRESRKKEAREKYEMARERGEITEMYKYSKQMLKLSEDMIKDSKKLIKDMGLPVIQAPSEGEAQCSWLVKKGDAYSVASQDYDSLLFGTPRLIQNMTLAKKRKLASGAYVSIQPQIIETARVLKELGINHEQLICLGILTGTDFNPGGIRGIGPKKALQLVKQYKKPATIFEVVEKQLKEAEQEMNFDWRKIFDLFQNPNVTDNYSIEFNKPNEKEIISFLCHKHDFSEERIKSGLQKLYHTKEKRKQQDLAKFL